MKIEYNLDNSDDYSYYARALIDSIERLFVKLRRNQRFQPRFQPVKVNLGSGLDVAPGWINIDGSLKTTLAGCPNFLNRLVFKLLTDSKSVGREQFINILSNNIFVHHDLRYGVPLPDSSTDFIYTSHALHHFYRDEAQALLADSFRVLRPGGTIRIAVPNLEYIFSLYQRGERERALEFFFYNSPARNQLSRRQYQYDFELLQRMLQASGYGKVLGKNPSVIVPYPMASFLHLLSLWEDKREAAGCGNPFFRSLPG
jgi:predicted SAM-dependent methyltransferase